MGACLEFKDNIVIMDIKRGEVLRYLGYSGKGIDKNTELLITDCIQETIKLAQPRFIHRTFRLIIEKGELMLGKSGYSIRSTDLSQLLKKSDFITTFLTTLGPDIDKKIKFYSYNNLERSIILDACAATLIEEVTNRVQDHIQKLAEPQNYSLTSRFSPGYGDLSLEIQSAIVKLLDATKNIGIETTEASMLIPSKSISAFLGWINKGYPTKNQLTEFQSNAPEGCKSCIQYNHCYYLKGETYCDFRKHALKS